MNNSNFKENTPNAARLITALRSTGYDNYSAIADLVDNCLDADANKIWIDITPTKESFMISISDDGVGMDEDILNEATRLGSKTERNVDSDLGKFGMGLITASLSIARKLTVITKQGERYFSAVQDIDEVIKSNTFSKILKKSDNEDMQYFNKMTNLSISGTVVCLDKCDHIQNENINQFSAKLIKELGQTFRYFIKSGKKIYLRGKEIRYIDPLMLDNKKTKVFSDETFNVNLNGSNGQIRVKIVLLPEYDRKTANMHGINIENQGFYLMRNNREIIESQTLGMFNKHNDYNRFRAEIAFSGNLDELMGVTFTKRNIKPKKQLLDKIHDIAYQQIKTIKKQVLSSKLSRDSKEVDHNKAERLITQKSKLLIKPKALDL